MIEWKNAEREDRRRLARLLSGCPGLLERIFHPTKPETLLPLEEMRKIIGAMSSGEKLLARVALDIWNYPCEDKERTTSVRVMDLVSCLDDKNFANVVRVLVEFGGIPTLESLGGGIAFGGVTSLPKLGEGAKNHGL